MDTTDSRISFDEMGQCDHCTTFDTEILPTWNFGRGHEKKLTQLVEKIKSKSRSSDFDCILGMSGGIDSSYLLHIVTTKYGLRPLVFHVDAGWNSQIAVNNIEKLVDGLSLDLYTEVIDWEEMKDLQRSFFRSGVPHIDTPQDHAFFATMYKFAARYNIKNIITGGNYSTECVRNPKEWMYYQSDSRQIKAIHGKFGDLPLSNFPTTTILWHKIFLPYVRGIRVIRLLDLIEYNKEEATDVLTNEYGFQTYPQKHFESRFTKFYESYWLPEKFGFDTRRVQLSSLILTEQMTRRQALEILERPAYAQEEISREMEYVADKIDVSIDDLREYFHSENKNYRDYKNQGWLYEVGSRISRFLGYERGGKR